MIDLFANKKFGDYTAIASFPQSDKGGQAVIYTTYNDSVVLKIFHTVSSELIVRANREIQILQKLARSFRFCGSLPK